MTLKDEQLEHGKIYYLDYGGTQIVGRYDKSDVCNHWFYDYLHYWNGYETYHHGGNQYCVKADIQEMRRATKPEKHALTAKEIEFETI